MTRTSATLNQTKALGIITEASPLEFPEGASIDETNFVINKDGRRDRRLGLGLTGAGSSSTNHFENYVGGVSDRAFAVVDWPGADRNNPDVDYVAIIWDKYVNLFRKTSPDFTYVTRRAFGSYVYVDKGSFVVADNRLFYAIGAKVGYMEFTGSSLSDVPLSLRVRDIWGVDDDFQTIYDLDYRPTGALMSNGHNYNVQNQGWQTKPWVDNPANYAERAARWFYSNIGLWPSNSDVWLDGKYFDPSNNSTTARFRPATLVNLNLRGSGVAPKGHFVVDFNSMGMSRYEQAWIDDCVFTASPSTMLFGYDNGGGVPSVVATFAGRMWYAGFSNITDDKYKSSVNKAALVLFSQVGSTQKAYEACHSQNDPTAEEINDLLATDGGTIALNEAGTILAMYPIANALVVFATKGIWAISGTDNGIFSATGYAVSKISDVVALKDTIVEADNTLFFWTNQGIYHLRPSEIGDLVANNIISDTIQTFYNRVPSTGKIKAFGTYDKVDSKLRWLYSDYENYSLRSATRFKHNKELIYDVVLQAWYTNTFDVSTDTYLIAAYVNTPAHEDNDVVETIVVGANTVEVGAGNTVVVTQVVRDRGSPSSRYVVLQNVSGATYKINFATPSNTAFKDWNLYDAAAYLITGYTTAGDLSKEKQIEYLTFHMNRTETGIYDAGGGDYQPTNPSSCKVRVMWGWANSGAAGKWSTEFEAYRHRRIYMPVDLTDTWDDGYSIVTTKNRVRGSGKSISMYISTAAGKDLSLLGWSVDLSGNGRT